MFRVATLLLTFAVQAPAADGVLALTEAKAADPPKWSEFKGRVGKTVRISTPEPAKWILAEEGDKVEVIPDGGGKDVSVVASQPGRYRLLAVGATAAIGRAVVVIEGGSPNPTPPTPTPPGPSPLPPDDPLRSKLLKVYQTDAGPGTPDEKSELRLDLAEMYRQGSALARNASVQTGPKLIEKIKTGGKKLAEDRLVDLRKAVAGELVAVLPDDPDATLTDVQRQAVGDLLLRLAAILESF